MLAKELRQKERELEKARARAQKLKQRAEQAEQELAAIKSSSTWKAGRAVVAVPSRIRRLGRK